MHRRLAVALSLLALAPLAASADDLPTVRERVDVAMQSTISFVVTTVASTGFTVTTTFVAPDRYRSTLTYGGTRTDVIIIGRNAYVNHGGAAYEKADLPKDVLAQVQAWNIPVDRLLPDRIVAGVARGRFLTTARGPQKDQQLTCTYDKTNYRISECSNEGMTLTFSRYDDPANAVNLPPSSGGTKVGPP